jgi:nicotinamidase-related amidase
MPAVRSRPPSSQRVIRIRAVNMPHAAIEPTKLLFAGARAAGLPVFYSTGDTRAASRPGFITATKRNRPPINPSDYAIRPEFKPEPDDVVITKQRVIALAPRRASRSHRDCGFGGRRNRSVPALRRAWQLDREGAASGST